MDIAIRQEQLQDLASIREVIEQAFGQSDEADLVERIRASRYFISGLSLVAEYKKQILGHILFSDIKIRTKTGNTPSLALAPVSVKPEYQGKGIGGKLIMRGLREATRLGHDSVILLGHPEYYPRFGFEPSSTWDISPPFKVPEENYMALELVPNGLKEKAGIVEYPEVWQLEF